MFEELLAGLAHLVEHFTCNDGVVRSNRTTGTKFLNEENIMLFAYQVIAVIFFICSFLGDYKQYSDSPSEIAGNLIGSAFAGALWPLTVLIHIFCISKLNR